MKQLPNYSQTLETPTTTYSREDKQAAAQSIIDQVAGNSAMFQQIYKEIPLTFLRTYDRRTKWPKKLKWIFAEIWTGRSGPNVIIAAPRGGGKSKMIGSLGFCLFFFRGLSIVDMGGALAQAKIVYGYFSAICYSEPRILACLPKEPMMEHSTGTNDNYFMCVAASPKAVRGPHPDVLMADEVCETPDELVDAALPMVDTSQTPLRILTSTFHKVFGIFQDIWDRADELGYKRYQWDIFDVVASFDPAIWDDPDLNRYIPDLYKLKELATGRNGDPEGWIPIMNVINAWRSKRTLDWFLVEYMGKRPSAAGLVVDPIAVDEAAFDIASCPQYNHVEGAEVVGGLDWGFSSMTAWTAFMRHTDDVKVELALRTYTQVISEEIIEDICDDVEKLGIRLIYADSAGKFENAALQKRLIERKLPCKVVEVVFSKDKESNLGNYRAHFERAKIKIPKTHQLALWQHKRYRYVPGTNKPQKKDDHIPDATMCALSHWPLGVHKGSAKDLSTTEGEAKPITSGLRNKKF